MAKQAQMDFASALAKMAAKLPVIEEKGKAYVKGQLRYTFARWEDIGNAIKPILSEEAFSLTFETKVEPDHVWVKGILMHASGHTQTTEATMPHDASGNKNAVQAIGSAIAYGKRYCAFALLNLSSTYADADDDAASIGNETITEEQVALLNKAMDETKTDKEKFCQHHSIEAIPELPLVKFALAKAELQTKKARQEAEELRAQALLQGENHA